MAGNKGQAGGKDSIPALAGVCLVIIMASYGLAWAKSSGFTPPSYIGSLDPDTVWELLIGGIVIASFLGAIGLWLGAAQGPACAAQA